TARKQINYIEEMLSKLEDLPPNSDLDPFSINDNFEEFKHDLQMFTEQIQTSNSLINFLSQKRRELQNLHQELKNKQENLSLKINESTAEEILQHSPTFPSSTGTKTLLTEDDKKIQGSFEHEKKGKGKHKSTTQRAPTPLERSRGHVKTEEQVIN